MDRTDYEAGETEEEKKEIEERKNKDAYFVMSHKGDSRYTSEGLPIVTESTRKAFMSELERNAGLEDPREIVRRWVNEIDEENPEVSKLMGGITLTFPEFIQIKTCAALAEIYELLKSQISNNNIFDYFKIGEKQEH
jgi:hypothetical protein